MQQHAFHLTLKLAHAPVFLFALSGIKTDFQVVVGFQDFGIMAPAQLSRQRLDILNLEVELLNLEKIGVAESLAELRRQVLGKPIQQVSPLLGFGTAFLLEFHNLSIISVPTVISFRSYSI